MKILFTLLFFVFSTFTFAQNSNVEIDSLQNDSIVLLYDSLPELIFFNPNKIENHTSKISTYRQNEGVNKITQALILVLFFAWFATWYKELFTSSFKSLYDFNFNHQYLRSKKNSNFIPLVLITLVLILFSVLFIKNNILPSQSLWYIFLFVALLVLYDIISNYIFLFFSQANVMQLIQNSFLSFHVVMLSVLVVLYFVANVDVHNIQKITAYIFCISIVLLSVLRLVRAYYLLITEKAKVFNLHFFIYLCTFKIMPFIILISIFLNK
ncbi:MAG: DUF4271 domain-containing protein [Chitinophagales bacterium]|nr:DUF4271 domain-containing protein [Chitinophagales bacterium]